MFIIYEFYTCDFRCYSRFVSNRTRFSQVFFYIIELTEFHFVWFENSQTPSTTTIWASDHRED